MRLLTYFLAAASAALVTASFAALAVGEMASDSNRGSVVAAEPSGLPTDAVASPADVAIPAGVAVSAAAIAPAPANAAVATADAVPAGAALSDAATAPTDSAPADAPRSVFSPRPDLGFTFVRIRYEGTHSSYSPTWAYDHPRAERHLYEAIDRTTDIQIEGPPIVLTLTDERIFEYPILYLCEPGYWRTNDEEVAALQRYFERGGFMIIDDFHDGGRGSVGPEWNNFYENIKQVFPDREPVELTADHPIWTVYYDIDPDAAVSTKVETRQTPWLGPEDDIYYGIFDDDGRLMCVICYNQDIGDGWEWPEYNFNDGSTVSFQMAINFIIYALTH